VLHLAWTVDHGRFWEEPANLAWVSATLDLSGAAIRAGVSRIVAAGTCYEYEWPAHGACSEDMTPVQSHTLYDTAKDATRRVLEVFLRQSGCAFAWARLFYLYGAGEPAKRLVPSVARALISGRAAECSNGEAVRDLLEVRDAAAALAAVTCSDLEGPVNIASGVAVRIGEVAERLGRIAGRPDLVRLGIRPDRPQDPPRIVADVSKLSMETDFRKSIGLEDGLAAAIAHWRSLAGSH
jgi:nucleoside-diphosphate-sugar epimerase